MEKLQISKKEVQGIMERDGCTIDIAVFEAVKPYSDIFFKDEKGRVTASRMKIMDEFIYPYVKIVD